MQNRELVTYERAASILWSFVWRALLAYVGSVIALVLVWSLAMAALFGDTPGLDRAFGAVFGTAALIACSVWALRAALLRHTT